jgi:hypothetical protein
MKIDHLNNSRCYLVTFGSGSEWKPALSRIRKQAETSGRFGKVFSYNEKDISLTFNHVTKEFFDLNQRGYGLWIWKPFIILNTLKMYPECQVLLYLDAGCEINSNPTSLRKLDEYIEIAKIGNGLGFELPFFEKDWTSEFVIEYMKAKKYEDSKQLAGGMFFIKNNEKSRKFLNQWIKYMLVEKNALLLGNTSRIKQNLNFKEHRFDQSIFSILWKKNKFKIIQDKSYWAPDWRAGRAFPIWSTRSKLRYSFNMNKNLLFLYRLLRITIIKCSLGKWSV